MSQIEVRPLGFPTTVERAQPGLLVWFDEDGKPHVAFKSEYASTTKNADAPDGRRCEAFNEAGEYLCDRDMPVYSCEIVEIDDE
ncbi:MAG: hypothetical protein ACE37K_11255 [Planctomycetota bacterium]